MSTMEPRAGASARPLFSDQPPMMWAPQMPSSFALPPRVDVRAKPHGKAPKRGAHAKLAKDGSSSSALDLFDAPPPSIGGSPAAPSGRHRLGGRAKLRHVAHLKL